MLTRVCFLVASLSQKLPMHGTPEMMRVPLSSLLLQIKAMYNAYRSKLVDCGGDRKPTVSIAEHSIAILRSCPDPPDTSAIQDSEKTLIRLEAVDPVTSHLTALGRLMADLPCSPLVGRLLFYGVIFGVARHIAGIAASLEGRKSVFAGGMEPEIVNQVAVTKAR